MINYSGWSSHKLGRTQAVEHYWQTRPHIFTQGLRKIGHLTIDVLGEYPQFIRNDEAYFMHTSTQQKFWVREILMSIDNHPAVYARSLTPLRASLNQWKRMRFLCKRPLADMLYHDPRITRSHFEITRLNPWQSLYRSLERYPTLPCGRFLARRSVFFKEEQPLMVHEVFLPEFWALLKKFSPRQQRQL